MEVVSLTPLTLFCDLTELETEMLIVVIMQNPVLVFMYAALRTVRQPTKWEAVCLTAGFLIQRVPSLPGLSKPAGADWLKSTCGHSLQRPAPHTSPSIPLRCSACPLWSLQHKQPICGCSEDLSQWQLDCHWLNWNDGKWQMNKLRSYS